MFTVENERRTEEAIDRSLAALRIPSATEGSAPPLSAPLQTPPPAFSRLEPLPAMRMPKGHFDIPTKGKYERARSRRGISRTVNKT